MSDYGAVVYQVSRRELAAGDLSTFKQIMKKNLNPDKQTSREMFQSLLFHMPDYDDDPREVETIPEVRSWMQKADREYPYLLYFVHPMQYIMVIASVMPGADQGLTLPALILYLKERNGAINKFCKKIGHDPDEIQTAIGLALKQYTG
jgi:hypothetical protein